MLAEKTHMRIQLTKEQEQALDDYAQYYADKDVAKATKIRERKERIESNFLKLYYETRKFVNSSMLLIGADNIKKILRELDEDLT